MVRRYVFFRFKEVCRGYEAMQAIVARTHEVLQAVPEVMDYEIGLPADETSLAAWDLSISIAFSTRDDLESGLSHPLHRDYADKFIKPRLEVAKAWNFTPEVETV